MLSRQQREAHTLECDFNVGVKRQLTIKDCRSLNAIRCRHHSYLYTGDKFLPIRALTWCWSWLTHFYDSSHRVLRHSTKRQIPQVIHSPYKVLIFSGRENCLSHQSFKVSFFKVRYITLIESALPTNRMPLGIP